MSSLRLSRRLLAFVSLCVYVSTLCCVLGQEPFQVKFRLVDKIVVPVTINGAGPYDFLLDTGATDTIVDRKLAEGLHLPLAGKMTVTTAQGDVTAPVVDIDSLSMHGAIVRRLTAVSVDRYANILPNVAAVSERISCEILIFFSTTDAILFSWSPAPDNSRIG